MDVRALREMADGRVDRYVEDLRRLVSIDSGSATPEGVDRVVDLIQGMLADRGWTVERRSHDPEDGQARLGDLLVAAIGDGPAPVPGALLVGHTDTVFDLGTVAERPFRVEGDRASGPGVADMKGGLLLGVLAVDLLRDADLATGSVTFVVNPDEEIGSPFSSPFIRELAARHDVAYVLEPGRANGGIVTARKGTVDLWIEVVGRAAHAGVEPEKGASAALAAAHLTSALHGLNGRWPGTTVNVGVLRAGTRSNVVAERARLDVDVRASTVEDQRAVEAAIASLCGSLDVPGTRAALHHKGSHLPMERTAAIASLAARAQAIAGEMDLELPEVATGGASDGNTIAAVGTPVLDGMGPVGGDAHAAAEWLDLGSVAPRAALLAALLASG
jgi:glutamate carboxypeptidase